MADTVTDTDAQPAKLEVKRQDGKIWSPVRSQWLVETPEERVRQEYLPVLLSEYGFRIEQIAEEWEVTGRGSGQARADFLIWRTTQDRLDANPPLIVVECKSDNVTISPNDYAQGDNYARLTNAQFFVTHNTRETRYWRVRKDRLPGYLEEIENIPHANASDKEIETLISQLKVFKEDEFADLLHQCHNVIRNRDHLDPAAAFDEIAKILFTKVWVEREMRAKRRRKNLFTVEFLREQLGDNPLDDLFDRTKRAYRAERIFSDTDRINLKSTTGHEIVRLLERYNLSDTSEDIKGIAFERFLGRTFRGEIGQFFTPRTIVEFMVRMSQPNEQDIICDPASGSGGFLIRFFEIAKQKILADVDQEYRKFKEQIEAENLDDAERAKRLLSRFDELQATLDQSRRGSRTWKLANERIFGTDANDRMARTSKMNMIMHGDGHGGVHHHNGFINVNGIFEGRFSVVLTNPPFGANVEAADVVTQGDTYVNEDEFQRYSTLFGERYRQAQARVKAARGKSILSLFKLPRNNGGRIRTEILFIERCIDLLDSGGRLGIVLPEGIFSNPSASYARVREFCEDRGYLRAVISLPKDTFKSAGADVRASLLFFQKFTVAEQSRFSELQKGAISEVNEKYREEIEATVAQLNALIEGYKELKDKDNLKLTTKRLKDYERDMQEKQREEARKLLRERFDYPVFMYEARKVGITPTGEQDENELFPNTRVPAGAVTTCLELYQQYLTKLPDITKTTVEPLRALNSRCIVAAWRALPRWDLKTARAVAFRIANPSFVPLDEYIEESTLLVKPWTEPEKLWPVYGVNNREGVFFSHYQKGSAFNAPYKRISKDWFFHNPTRANVGSLGRVPDIPADAITSPEYQVWRIKKHLRPEYVEVLIRSRFFLDLVAIHRVGAVKERLFVQNLTEIPIPVLSDDEQLTVVKQWGDAQEALRRARERVAETLQGVDGQLRSLCASGEALTGASADAEAEAETEGEGASTGLDGEE